MALREIPRKPCKACGEVKSLSDFYAQPGVKDGRQSRCKECAKAAVRANRLNKLAYYRQYDRERASRPERRANTVRVVTRMRTNKPAAYRAHSAVSNAVRDGRLERKPCEACGADRAFGHHDDYAKPLDVRWLCQPCHVAWHHANGPGLNGAEEESAA